LFFGLFAVGSFVNFTLEKKFCHRLKDEDDFYSFFGGNIFHADFADSADLFIL
jgi:hypothetical protein